MARAWFGGTSNDYLFDPINAFGSTIMALNTAPLVGTCWDSQTGGTQYTDLLDATGTPITSLSVSGSQLPAFQGPDGIMQLWVDLGSGRVLLVAWNQATVAAASATQAQTSATAAAQSETNAAGSATAAAGSATAAGSSQTSAGSSASAAATSATNAATSASSAATSASQAAAMVPAAPAKGDLIVYNGTAWVSLRATADGQLLVRDSTQTSGWRFGLDGTIHGTGSPQGIVTAAVGRRYVDDATTNGAVEWTKVSGAGNTGWVCTKGDTARRVLAAWDATGAFTTGSLGPNYAPRAGSAGGVWIRRMNSRVILTLLNVQAKNAVGSGAYDVLIPGSRLPGFFSDSGVQGWSNFYSPALQAAAQLRDGAATVGVTFVGSLSAGALVVAGAYSTAIFEVDTDWPTSIPAAG